MQSIEIDLFNSKLNQNKMELTQKKHFYHLTKDLITQLLMVILSIEKLRLKELVIMYLLQI